MSDRPGVTLQINLAAGDVRHVPDTLPHLLRQWGAQVREVLLTIDVPYRGPADAATDQRLRALRRVLEECGAAHPNARISDVDYSPRAMAGVGEMFFGGRRVPTHDLRHRPIYAYFYGVYDAACDYVFHLDSDMLFGGGSQTWMAEAVALLESRPDLLTCSPLPGPPTRDGSLPAQRADREPLDSPAFRFDHVSTRLFLLDRRVFRSRMDGLRPGIGPWKSALKAVASGLPPYDFAEGMMGRAMRRSGMWRVDFLGTPPGMWSLHPLHHTERYHRHLPELIRRVEAGEVPESQRGHYDLTEELLDDWLAPEAVVGD